MINNQKVKKILIATGIYPPDVGGPATYSKLLFQELPKRGIEVRILSFGEVRHLPKVLRHLTFFLKVLWRARDADIIFAQDTVSVGLPASLAAKLLGKRFIIRVAGDYAWEQASQRFGVKDSIDDFQDKHYGIRTELFRRIQKFVVNRAEKVFTPSNYFSALVAKWCKNPKKVITIYNGIQFYETYKEKMSAREDLGIEQNTKIIFSAGRLVPWKGFKTLISIMPELIKEDESLRLIIAGDGPEKESLMEEIKNTQMNDKVTLLGRISRERLFDFLCAADVFVLNTSFESFSFQIVEAMAVGTPIIATKVGNLPEIVENEVDGILVPYDNRVLLIDAIKRIKNDKAYRERIVAKAKIKAAQFSIDSTINNLIIHLTQSNDQ